MTNSLDELGWKNFQLIRNHLVEYDLFAQQKSLYWDEETDSLDYLIEASPKLISKLRDHCHWLTGVRSYDYKNHHLRMEHLFRSKYDVLRSLDPKLQFFGESRILGDFGFEIDNNLINLDTLKFFESIMALNLVGELERLKNTKRPTVVEIGAGWGGFLAMLNKYIPNIQMIIVDLPMTLLFSATYLPTVFPELKVGYFGSKTFTGQEDIIFMVPNQFPLWEPKRIDLAVNLVSFQEMTTEQVSNYSNQLKSKFCSVLYSYNKSKSENNAEIQSVDNCLSNWDYSQSIKLLNVDYTIIKLNSNEKLVNNTQESSRKKFYLIKILQVFLSFFKGRVKSNLVGFFYSFVKPEICDLIFLDYEKQKKIRTRSGTSLVYEHKIYYSNLDFKFLK